MTLQPKERAQLNRCARSLRSRIYGVFNPAKNSPGGSFPCPQGAFSPRTSRSRRRPPPAELSPPPLRKSANERRAGRRDSGPPGIFLGAVFNIGISMYTFNLFHHNTNVTGRQRETTTCAQIRLERLLDEFGRTIFTGPLSPNGFPPPGGADWQRVWRYLPFLVE